MATYLELKTQIDKLQTQADAQKKKGSSWKSVGDFWAESPANPGWMRVSMD